MSDEQRRVALFQAQPEGLGLFLRPAALSFAHLEQPNYAHSALPDTKTDPAGRIGLVLTGPNKTERLIDLLNYTKNRSARELPAADHRRALHTNTKSAVHDFTIP
ncbi:MAG: hypothetical protein JAY90_02830 [Candidatus Thiodiazotropha lotti]|nr:hypothetical protein [Candidatus Thiodiazotropha lotti]